MILPDRFHFALAGLLAVSVAFHVAQWQRNRAMAAQVAPLKQAAEDAAKLSNKSLKALQSCEAEKLRMRGANERAVREAQEARAKADASLEAWERRLDSAPADCDAFLKARICPALLPDL